MKRHANIAVFIPQLGCSASCVYCNQRLISGTLTAPTPQQVSRQVQTALEGLKIAGEQAQIAFFGGSFTCIERERMIAYLACVQPFIKSGQVAGIRLSTRPDGINEQIVSLLGEYGVTAVELGTQSMDEKTLVRIGRGHTAADTRRAARLIRAGGLELGVQMMIGLPGEQCEEQALANARRLIALRPDAVRIYPTLVLAGTPLARLYAQGAYQPLTLRQAVATCHTLYRYFHQRGVTVLRMGLHADESLQRSGIVAGPFHPAFGEMVYARGYLEEMRSILRAQQAAGTHPAGREACFAVAWGCISQAVGVKRENVTQLQAEFGVKRVRFQQETSLAPGTVRLISLEDGEITSFP